MMLLRVTVVSLAIAVVNGAHCGTFSCGAGYTQRTPPEGITCQCGTDAAPVACAVGVPCNAGMALNLAACCTANSCNMGARTGLDPNVQTDRCRDGTFFTGSTCVYNCNFGYALNPAAGFPLICDGGGQYDASGGVCVADTCTAANANTDRINGQCLCLPGFVTPAITTAGGTFTHSCTANTCTNAINAIPLLTDLTPCLPGVALVTGGMCAPNCATGYTTNPTNLNLVCQANGDFDASIIQCVPNVCTTDTGFPGNNLLSNAQCTGQLTGGTCTPRCLPGYFPARDIYLECTPTYTPAAGTCAARPCPNHSTAVVAAGVGITCPCDTGYVGTITFGATLQWVGTCDPAPCNGGPAAAPAALNEVDYSSCTLQVTDNTCIPTCKDGFIATGANNGQFVLSCDAATNLYVLPAAQLTCTAAACPPFSTQALTTVAPPAAPTCGGCNAATNYAIAGGGAETWDAANNAWSHTCVITCPGYTCPSGWVVQVPAATAACPTASPASCTPALCCTATACTGPVAADPNLDYTPCNTLVSGQTCQPTCSAGYTMMGGPDLDLICPAGAYMSTIVCQANRCTGGPFMARHANASYVTCNTMTTQTAGGIACATCDGGYTATGTITNLICRTDLTYDATGFTCTPTACTTAVPVDVGVLSYATCTGTGVVTGQECRPTCRTGYVQGGTAVKLVCIMGNFDASASTCTKADCPPNADDTVTTGICLCSAGYTGTPLWTGLAWTSTCTPNPCPAETITNSVNYKVVGSLTGVTGITLPIACDPGYSASSGNAICTAAGWNPLPGCIANICQATQVQNSDFSAAGSVLQATVGSTQTIVCNTGFVCSRAPCEIACAHSNGLDAFSTLTCNPVECPRNAITYGTCTCSTSHLAFPAVPGVNFDTATSMWTHRCYASCATHSCSTGFDHRATPLVPSNIFCAGEDDSTCSDALCCVGLVIDPSGQRLRTTEAGGIAIFTIRLVGQPTSAVTVTITSSDITEGTVTPPQLVFNSLSWNTVETVTVRGVNDDIDEPADVDYQIQFALTGDPDWTGNAPQPIPATNSDDDERGVRITLLQPGATELVVQESGGVNPEFEVVLTSMPTADVFVPIVSSLPTEGQLLTGALTNPTAAIIDLQFTVANWNVPQTVTLFGQNDNIDDGDQPFLILTNLVRSADTVSYDRLNPPDIAAECLDDDTVGVNIALVAGSTTRESGTLNTASFTISLRSEPTSVVTIPIRSSDVSEGMIVQSFVTFSASTWNIVQTLVVTGVNDFIADGDIGYSIETLPATSADPKYSNFDADDLQLVNVDDDTAGVLIAPTTGLVTSEAGGTSTYTVVLTSEPTTDVTIQPISRDPFEGTASPTSFVFTSLNWMTPQTVTVTGVDDLVDDSDQTYNVATIVISGDNSYDGFSTTDVSVTNTNNDQAGIAVTPRSGLFTSEDGTRQYFTVVLESEPTDDVTYSFQSDDTTEGAVALPNQFRFTASNWDVPRTVTVTGIPDFVDDDNVTYAVTSTLVSTVDANYLTLLPATVTLVNINDDFARIVVDPNSGLFTSEDLQDVTFSIVLDSQPLFDVTLQLSTTHPTEGLILSTTPVTALQVIFTGINWATPQRITIQGQDDTNQDGDIPYTILIAAATSMDPKYNMRNAQDVSIVNLDNDTPGMQVFPNTSVITTEDPGAAGAAIIAIVLTSRPQVGTLVLFDITSSDLTEGRVTPSLTFNQNNWNQRQTITITGFDDDMQDGDIDYYVLISPSPSTTDLNYQDFPRAPGYRINVTNMDDDVAGIDIPDLVLQTSESGTTASTTVALITRPLDTVSLRITTDNSEGLLSTAGGSQNVPTTQITLTFTNVSWSVPQTITVTGQNDYIADGAVVYNLTVGPAVSVGDRFYNARTHPGITVNNSDDDVVGIELTHTMNLATTEAGGTDYFEVALTSEPTAQVVMWATSRDSRECSVGRGAITFTSLNWNVTQTVTITGVADEIDDDDQLVTIDISALMSGDLQYNGLKPADVQCTNRDDDTAAVVVTGVLQTFTTERGDATEFVIALASQPVADVTINVESDKPDEGTVSPAQIIFTSVTWGNSVTVTITGVDDMIDDGDVPYKVIVLPSVSTDPKYSMANGQNVDLENKDDDVASIIVEPTIGLTTTEAGGTAVFTVVLSTEPVANVEIGFTTTSGSEVQSIFPNRVTFSPLDWNITKNVTVTGADDGGIDDGNVEYVIITQPALSAGDPTYNGMNASNVNITNIDDDSAGFTIIGTTLQTTEIGQTAAFTINLNSQPSSDVTVELVVEDLTEGSIGMNEIIFTMGNWSTPFSVTVTPVDDFIDDGDITYKITTQPAVSADTDYQGSDAVDVYVRNVDNDTAAIIVTGFENLPFRRLQTNEANTQPAVFYIRLASEPISQVIITAGSSDGGEGFIEVSSREIRFTGSDWNQVQTITVHGQNDDIDDGDVLYNIRFSAATTTDPNYDGMRTPDIACINIDDDVRGLNVTPVVNLRTAEGWLGRTSEVRIKLNTQPTAIVQVDMFSSNVNEGIPVPSSLVFTTSDWNDYQTVTITGVDDDVDDGDITYRIRFNPFVSNDMIYANVDADDLIVVNIDDDMADTIIKPIVGACRTVSGNEAFVQCSFPFIFDGRTFSSCTNHPQLSGPKWCSTRTNASNHHIDGAMGFCEANCTGGLTTAEAGVDVGTGGVTVGNGNTNNNGANPAYRPGGTAEFTIELTSRPMSDVTITMWSSDLTEGDVRPKTLTFIPVNWASPQTVTVTANDDDIADGNQLYSIRTSSLRSLDPIYNNLLVADVLVNNTDDDTPAITITPQTGLVTSETGTEAFIEVQLTSQPEAGVSITANSTDLTEGTVSPQYLLFTSTNWNVRQTVTVTGVADNINDDDRVYDIVFGNVLSTDHSYRFIEPINVRVVNTDVRDECVMNSAVCTNAGQECIDPDTSPLVINNWECRCGGSSSGSARTRPAVCVYTGECVQNSQTCITAGQICVDPTTTNNDWQCECQQPSVGTPRRNAAASCVLDECIANSPLCAAVGQTCEDPNTLPTSLGDWMCQCGPQRTGSAVAQVAVCEWIGECRQRFPICTSMNQTCIDPNTAVTGDWQCACIVGSGTSTGAAAECIINECTDTTINFETCKAVDQVCEDPNTSANSLGDWICRCTGTQEKTGIGYAMPATCIVDECVQNHQTCLAVGQTCNDPNTSPSSIGDWTCNCVQPAIGSQLNGQAVCIWQGECASTFATCTNAKQTCSDPNLTVQGDWQCVCVSPYRTTSRTGAVATCIFDECDQNRDTCFAVGQTCVDTNTDPRSLGDWKCVCGEPARGEKVGGVAECAFAGECSQQFGVCTAAGQTCNDPNVAVVGDWECLCVAPQQGSRVGGPAVCVYDECLEFWPTCSGAGQTCFDPNPTPTRRGDWVCNCVEPSQGSARAQAATCAHLGECVANHGVCTQAGQACNDPNTQVDGDWECRCVGQSTGVSTGQASTQCEIDECASNGAICTASQQICVDRNKNVTSLNDWVCQCSGGENSGVRVMGVATCVLDECRSLGVACTSQGQRCVDVNTAPESVGDWVCVCTGSSSGQATAQAATCTYTGECIQKSVDDCIPIGKTCVDPQASVSGDAVCQCVYPSTVSPTNSNLCELDECITFATVCSSVGQTCRDPDKTAPNNWECVCQHTNDRATAGTAICQYTGECQIRQSICAQIGTACFDPDPDVPDNWQCKCPPPMTGKQSGGSGDLTCILDECNGNSVCSDQSQACNDPNTSPLSTGDWTCSCTGGTLVGTAVARAATCIRDECRTITGGGSSINNVCTRAGQLCIDANKQASSLNDWTCNCIDSTGVANGAPATCTHTGECVSNAQTCAAAGQSCTDPNPSAGVTGDWECRCVPPQTGVGLGKAAVCVLDECATNERVCHAVGQLCFDPNKTPVSLGDWMCRCASPATGSATGAPATCTEQGECQANAQTCYSRGQACNDPSTMVGDWECFCIGNQVGRAVGKTAICDEDECIANGRVCRAVGQTCTDPFPTPLSKGDWQCNCLNGGSQRAAVATTCSLQGECVDNAAVCNAQGQACFDPASQIQGDWRCVCVFPEVGWRQGKVAPCILDECLNRGSVCTNAGQRCVDPNTNPLSLNDWQCICVGSSSGNATAQTADCVYDGECISVNTVCSAVGQACTDPNILVTNDWECQCVLPFRGGNVGGVATCELDECVQHGTICGQAGQLCVDPNLSPTSMGDWRCECYESTGTPAVGKLAQCTFPGECALHSSVCTSKGQSCRDTNAMITGDWQCICVTPMVGSSIGQPATCVHDECNMYSRVCSSVGQRCRDPNAFSNSLGDWTCECSGSDETGTAVGMAAVCIRDECRITANREICSAVGQLCVDANVDPTSTRDWACQCDGSGTGSSPLSPATCVYTGECRNNGHLTCSTAGQTCFDPNETQDSDWKCRCIPPLTGESTASVASCVLDECVEFGRICTDAGQVCEDINTNPSSVDDWICRCQEPLAGTATRAAATCSFQGECITNAVTCTSVGQSCVDPDFSTTNDWACICLLPQTGANATMATANCRLDECILHGSTCTSRGQRCVDPDTDPESTADWRCECVSPGVGSARGIAAECRYSEGECIGQAAFCAGAGQACSDPDITRTGDWTCICVPPTQGTGVASLSECHLDECLGENAEICRVAGQICRDPNTSPGSVGDWTCNCQGSSTGSAVRSVATCLWSGECVTQFSRCAIQGQTCFDPTEIINNANNGDWQCQCIQPLQGVATGQIADCTLDECLSISICDGEGQTCFDPDQRAVSVGDWECRCAAPATGTQTAGVARCILDECGFGGSDVGSDGARDCPQCRINRGVCIAASNQICQDPDTTTLGDWECVCTAPFSGRGVGRPAMCVRNECNTQGRTCTALGQRCNDPSQATGDWTCNCLGSALTTTGIGSAVAAAAQCQYSSQDLCNANSGTCTAGGQACDGATAPWKCVCIPPQTGEATQGLATCILDECIENRAICQNANQICMDPDRSPDSVGDWLCRCSAPSSGVQVGRPAKCELDECVSRGAVCQSVGQQCIDPNKSPGSTGDWSCSCVGSASGTARAMQATCAYTGECATNANTCTAVGQTCVDLSPAIGDWQCTCVLPARGNPADKGATVCTLNECLVVGSICTNVGQSCNDPAHDAASLDDWVCACVSGATRVAGPATCNYQGDCIANAGTCTSVGQDCVSNMMGSWQCDCPVPFAGSTPFGATPCTLDECDEGLPNAAVCSAASQLCRDPNQSANSLGDWICSCAGDNLSVGAATGMAAVCVRDECLETIKSAICTRVGQLCYDPNTADSSLNDFQCRCLGSGVGPNAVGMAASCNYMGACATGAPVCGNFSQSCFNVRNENATEDYVCRCVPPLVEDGIINGKQSRCILDECIEKGKICAASGQRCNDINKASDSTGDWQCLCPNSDDASTAMVVVSCPYTGECDRPSNRDACVSVGQVCVDPNTEVAGDWQCECVSPQEGSPAPGRAANCIFNECKGRSKGYLTCISVGQRCNDPNTSPGSQNDWTCQCLGSTSGAVAVATIASCIHLGECSAFQSTCAASQQYCRDQSGTADWQCLCPSPAVGIATAKAAVCELDECQTNRQICAAQRQICVDPNTGLIGDWECRCVSPESGLAGVTRPAVCISDECVTNGAICTAANQTCSDPNPSRDSTGDWQCACGNQRSTASALPNCAPTNAPVATRIAIRLGLIMQSNTVSVIDLTTLRTILSSGPVSQSSNVRVGTRNQLAYLVEAVAGESRSQGQVAESYRRALLAANTSSSSLPGITLIDDVWVGDCVVNRGYKCNDATTACSDSDGLVVTPTSTYQCSCAAPSSGLAKNRQLNIANDCISECSTCPEVTTAVAFTLEGTTVNNARTNTAQITEAMAKAMGIPVENIQNVTFVASGGKVIATAQVTEKTNTTATALNQRLVGNAQTDGASSSSGSLAASGFPSSSVLASAATSAPLAQSASSDDDTIGGLKVWQLILIIVAGVLLLLFLIYMLTCRSKKPEPLHEPKNNIQPEVPEENRPFKEEMQDFGSPAEDKPPTGLQTPADSPAAAGEPYQSFPNEQPAFESPTGSAEGGPSYTTSYGRGARRFDSLGPNQAQAASPYSSVGRGTPIPGSLLEGSDAAPGTSGWV